MVGELVPAQVDFKSAGPDFWKRYHAYRRERQKESRPDDPMTPDEVEEIRLKRDDPFDLEYHFEMVEDGVMVSWFSGSTSRPGSPAHESNRHLFWADIYVRPDHRRQGIATSVLPLLVELMDRHGCTVVGFGAEDPPGHAFLQQIGVEAKLVGAENRLKLAGVDWKMVARWIQEGRKRNPRTTLEIHDGPLPDALLDDFAPQLTGMLQTIPFESLDVGEILVTPEHMRDFHARLELTGATVYTVFTREPDDVISALTDVTWSRHRPTIIEQRFTGVRPDARGRGLGKWIKGAMLTHLRERHPEAEWVVTDNASSNAPMLAINKKLGFKQFRLGAEYQIRRDTIAARVKGGSG